MTRSFRYFISSQKLSIDVVVDKDQAKVDSFHEIGSEAKPETDDFPL